MIEGAIVVVAVAAAALFIARSLRRSVLPAQSGCDHADDCPVSGCCGCEAMRCEDPARAGADRIESHG